MASGEDQAMSSGVPAPIGPPVRNGAADPKELTYSAAQSPNVLWWLLGLLLGLVNAVRHHLQGYRTPRDFGTADVDRSVSYGIDVVARWLDDGGLNVNGRRILEVGPGPDLGTGAVLMASGAAQYTAADRFPLAEQTDPVFYDRLAERLGRRVDPLALQYVVTTFPDVKGVEGPFDLIVSNAALEHFDDVPATFKRFAELLTPGGTMCHHVDSMTHMRGVRERDPLNILRYPAALYRLLSFPGAPNRLRASDFSAAAAAAGFRCEVVPGITSPASYVSAVQPGLARTFRQRTAEDLRLLSFTLVCTRA